MFAMTRPTATFPRLLPAMLLYLTLTGAADAAASDGPVVGWGHNHHGQATPPAAVNGVSGTASEIAASGVYSCAIQAGKGNVVCWGDDTYGQATPPPPVNGVSGTASDIAAGWNHSCAIQARTGNVVCWGADSYGKATPPAAVNGVSGTASDIAAGGDHSCAIQAGSGNVVCWGEDGSGKATPPDAVNGVTGTAIAIAAGDFHSCAIQAGTGKVACWGDDYYYGQATPPAAVNGVSGTATAIAAGGEYSCAIQAGTGNVVCWGNDELGRATPPDAVNGVLGTATDISVGHGHALAVGASPGLIKAQKACINEMNNNGEKVNKAQLKQNERCMMDFQRGKLVAPMTFDDCMTADRKGKVQTAEERTAMREGIKCNSLDVPLPFAYIDSATVNAAAVAGARDLTYAIFGGPPMLDADLVAKSDDTDAARCQLEMLKRADKLENTVLKEVIKAKKKALKSETVNSGAALELKLEAVFSSNVRISRGQDSLVKGVDRKCAVLPAAPDTVFPGACGAGNPDLNEVEACVIAAARCEACSTINAFNDLDLDCDQVDDQIVNGSCL